MGFQYSVRAVQSGFTGPGGLIKFEGKAEGDILVCEFNNPDQITTTARDGHVVHTVVSDTDSATVRLRLQKTSVTNTFLRQISNAQRRTGALQIGVLNIADPIGSGETVILTHAVLSNAPGSTHSDDQPVMEWVFSGIMEIIQPLPIGVPFGVTPPYKL